MMLIKRLLPNVVETHPFGLYTYKSERPTINKTNKRYKGSLFFNKIIIIDKVDDVDVDPVFD